MSDQIVPRLRWPLQVSGGSLAVVEQDSEADINQCVVALLRTRLGERADDPSIGWVYPTHSELPLPLDELVTAVARHEPRITVTAQAAADVVDRALTQVTASWRLNSDAGA